jgi:hypothetical protein
MSYATLYALWADPVRADRLGHRRRRPDGPSVREPATQVTQVAHEAVHPGLWRAWAERTEAAPAIPARATGRRTVGWLAAHHPHLFPRPRH